MKLKQISKSLANNLLQSGIISLDDLELYDYGIQLILSILINFVTTILIGIFFDMILETFLFILIYIPLRTYAGGYHAKNHLKCYILSVVIIISYLLTIKYIYISCFISLLIIVVSSGIICILAPVENLNKPLIQSEQRRYGKISRVISSDILLVAMVLARLNLPTMCGCIALTLSLVAAMLIMGKLKLMKGRIQKC